MLSDAIREIRAASAVEAERRRHLYAKRIAIKKLDSWIGEIEAALEGNRPAPSQTLTEASAFLAAFDQGHAAALAAADPRQPMQVLDILFEAQEQLQRRPGAPLA